MQRITSRENPMIKNVSALMLSSRERRTQRLFVAEGERLCGDAAKSGAEIVHAFFTDSACKKYPQVCELIRQKAQNSLLISEELAQKIADTKTPQGIFCVCRMLDKTADLVHINKNNRFVVLENLQDPSNMGAVFRSAEAFGLDGVILAGACCDVYAPKAVRAGMGAVFRMPLFLMPSGAEAAKLLNRNGIRTAAAVVGRTALPPAHARLGAGCAVFIGNEGNGLSQECIQECQTLVTIPMTGRAESLNAAVAAGILIWEMIRE
ncbi:MAG: RNA methyltransferase [Firmicutes bacterium]|nr:RNA methyltransferase [Bacillota bacterium]